MREKEKEFYEELELESDGLLKEIEKLEKLF